MKLPKLTLISKRTCSLSTRLSQKYERFSWFLEDCNCTKQESDKIWNHVNQFESNNDNYCHIEPWFMAQENMKRIEPPTEAQKGCFDIIPNLTAKPVWDKQQFEFVSRLENNFDTIYNELIALKNSNKTDGFQQYKNANDMGATDTGHWNVFYFFLHDLLFKENMQKFPKTMDIINNINTPKLFHHALLSCLSPDSHIIPHNGPTNKKLRVYLPILLEKDSNILRVDQEIVTLKEGECIIFDDSFVHEAWNKSIKKSRFVLIFDIWHPDLTESETDFISIIQKMYERNLLEIAKSNPQFNDNKNPYFAMLNASHIDIPFHQIYCGL